MAAYTSTATGNWNSTSTWSPAGIPGSGDTAVVASPNVVTVPDGYTATIGPTGQATGTVALTVNSGGWLKIGGGASGALYLQGDLSLNGTSECFTMQAGSQLRFVPASGQRIAVSFITNNAGCLGTINGSSGARCTALTDATALAGGGLKGYFKLTGAIARGIVTMTRTDCTDLDDGSTNGFCAVLASTAGQAVTWDHNTFTRCSKAFVNCNGNNTGNINYTNNVHSASVLTSGLSYDFRFNNAVTSGQRNITGNVWDATGQFSTPVGCAIKWNIFGGQPTFTDGATSQWASNASNLHTWAGSGSSGIKVTGDLLGNYFAIDGTTNIHYTSLPSVLSYGPTIDSCIFEAVNISSDGQGDCIHDANGATAGLTCAVRRNITLPTQGTNNQAGTLITVAASANYYTWTLEHNTCYAGTQPAVAFGETNNQPAGSIASLRANLVWNTTKATNSLIAWDSSHHLGNGGTQDVVAPANANYNGRYNLHEESPYPAGNYAQSGNGYAANFSVLPGANDLPDQGPQFVDGGRNLGAWAVHKGQSNAGDSYATKVANGIAYASTNPTVLIPDLVGWVQAGFAPTNAAFRAASYPGDASTADAAGNPWPGGAPGIGAIGVPPAGLAYGAGRSALRPHQAPADARRPRRRPARFVGLAAPRRDVPFWHLFRWPTDTP